MSDAATAYGFYAMVVQTFEAWLDLEKKYGSDVEPAVVVGVASMLSLLFDPLVDRQTEKDRLVALLDEKLCHFIEEAYGERLEQTIQRVRH